MDLFGIEYALSIMKDFLSTVPRSLAQIVKNTEKDEKHHTFHDVVQVGILISVLVTCLVAFFGLRDRHNKWKKNQIKKGNPKPSIFQRRRNRVPVRRCHESPVFMIKCNPKKQS